MHGYPQLEREIALTLIVARATGLLADLVAIGLGERPKPRRRYEPPADLGGQAESGEPQRKATSSSSGTVGRDDWPNGRPCARTVPII